MKLLYRLQDQEYQMAGEKHTRSIARVILQNHEGLFAIHHLVRNDAFGMSDYYETPGGGVDAGETPAEAAKRECLEETGYRIEIIAELGIVEDDYNLISRHNINHFYLAKVVGGDGVKAYVSEGDCLIKETLYLPINEVLALYDQMDDHHLPGLVKRRERPIWQLVADKL